MRSSYAYRFSGFLLLLWAMKVWAGGPTGILIGRVEDRENGDPLSGAAVLVQGLLMGATADSLGRFTIADLPVGQYRIEARMMGYRTVTAEVEIVTSLKDDGSTEVVLALQPIPLELDEVTVTADRRDRVAAERSPMSLRVIPSETFRLASLPTST